MASNSRNTRNTSGRSSSGNAKNSSKRRYTEEEYYSDEEFYEDDLYEDEDEDEFYEEAPRKKSTKNSVKSSSKSSSKSGSGSRKASSSGKKSTSKAKAKKKRTRRLLVFAAEILVLCVLGVAVWAVMKQTSTQKINVNEEEIIKKSFNETVHDNVQMKGYRNIALFGIDARDDNLAKSNRSDTIIIASINQDTGEVKLCSVYRDTYMNLGNDRYSKCNAAYAQGGPQQAIQMLNMNLDMNITDYISVGFTGLIDVIDNLGGVQIDVHSEEISHLNNYQASMWSTEDKARITDNYVKVNNPGVQTLNGMQATAYCRIRYTAGDDFRRAERQRTVIQAILTKAQQASFSQLSSALDSALPHVATSLSTSEMLDVLKDIASYKIVSTDGFPFEDGRATGKVGSAGSCVIPVNLASNVQKLHEYLFEDQSYVVSDAVQTYSARVSKDTGR